MEANWKQSLAWVLTSEGGNDDDPDDPGGRTHNGITQREYNAYCQIAGLAQGDVWKCPDPVRDDIYHRSYWLPYCPTLPPGVDYVFFDASVNTGSHQAVVHLQRALQALHPDLEIHDDGHIGVVTSAALSDTRFTGINALLDQFAQERVKSYKQFRGYWKYGKGWLSRVEFARVNALTLVGA